MTSKPAHPETLFHLVPANKVAYDALLHPDNKLFVLSSMDNRLGLEVGFHVSSIPQGHVITRLGRNADLILPESTYENPMSAIHVAFETNPRTHLVGVSVRSKRVSSVSFSVATPESNRSNAQEKITGDGVLHYGQSYNICIACYLFVMVWRTIPNSRDIVESLKNLTVQGYQSSLQRLQYIRSRDLPTEYNHPTEYKCSEALSWHVTRLHPVKGSHLQDIKHLRHEIGSGSYGKVYSAVDQDSGKTFAIKIVDLKRQNDIDAARAILHREIKVMESLKHVSYIFTTYSF